jgi:hypothetical protein
MSATLFHGVNHVFTIVIWSEGISRFFTALALQKAHWYNVLMPSDSDLSREEINRIFPPLSSLLNNIEVMVMNQVLEASGLC